MMERHWEEHGRSSEDNVVSDTVMEDVGGCELGMCGEVSWEQVVDVLKHLKRGKAPGSGGILNEMVIYGGEWLVEVMQQVMNLVIKSEFCPADWRRCLLVPLHKMVTVRK